VVGRTAEPEKMIGLQFEQLYPERLGWSSGPVTRCSSTPASISGRFWITR
jgi:hypothetical protein